MTDTLIVRFRDAVEAYARKKSAPGQASMWGDEQEQLHPRDAKGEWARKGEESVPKQPASAPGQKGLLDAKPEQPEAKAAPEKPVPAGKPRQLQLLHHLDDLPNQQDLFNLDKIDDEPKAAAKEPWQMTRTEHTAERVRRTDEFKRLAAEHGGVPKAMSHPAVLAAWRALEDWGDLDIGHKPAVTQAVRAGKPVPPEVLADYPDLKPSKPLPAVTRTPANPREPSPAPQTKAAEPAAPKKPVNQNLVEYAVQELFKGKKLDAAAKAVAKKFNGSNNVFLGGEVSVTPQELKAAMLDRAAEQVRQFAPKVKEGMKHVALQGVSQQFNIDEKTLASHLAASGDVPDGVLRDHPDVTAAAKPASKALFSRDRHLVERFSRALAAASLASRFAEAVEHYAKTKPAAGQKSLWGDEPSEKHVPKDPAFEQVHPREPDGTFAEKEGGSEGSKTAAEPITGWHTVFNEGGGFSEGMGQRGPGTYIGLDKPFQGDSRGGVQHTAKVAIDPREILDPRGLIPGSDPEKSKADMRTAHDKLNAMPRSEVMEGGGPYKALQSIYKSMGYKAEAGEIEPGQPEHGRELNVWDREHVELKPVSTPTPETKQHDSEAPVPAQAEASTTATATAEEISRYEAYKAFVGQSKTVKPMGQDAWLANYRKHQEGLKARKAFRAESKPKEEPTPEPPKASEPEPIQPPGEPKPEPPAPAPEDTDDSFGLESTPRGRAENATKRQIDEDYAWARASAIRNAGEDLLGSARHKANEWRGLEQAESDGNAAQLVTRDNLLKYEPHGISAWVDENPRTAVAMHVAMRNFPPQPGYGKHYRPTDEEAKRHREQYLEAYRTVKQKAEELTRTESDPKRAMETLQETVTGLMRKFRGQKSNDYISQATATDRYNPVANGLAGLWGDLYPEESYRIKGGAVRKQLNAFDTAMRDTYGLDGSDADASRHAAEILEGTSIPKSFGMAGKSKSGRPRMNPAEMYVAHAERVGGPDIKATTPEKATEHLIEKQGLRGVQFGNYVSDEEREHHLQKCAEAFADLADLLGIPEERIAWHGDLGVAFGARGKGQALAHYEGGSRVINLTRAKGVGSLAHEWGHFIDHALTGFNIMLNEKGQPDSDMMSDHTSAQRFAKDEKGNWKMETDAKGRQKMVTIDHSKDPLWKSFDDVRKAWKSSGFTKRLGQSLKKFEEDGQSVYKGPEYWQSNREMLARTFERYVQRKLEKAGRKNTYLAGLDKKYAQEDGLWPTDAEVDAMTPAYDAMFDHLREGIEKGTYSLTAGRLSVRRDAALVERFVRAFAAYRPTLSGQFSQAFAASVEQYARHKPAAGQTAFQWDESKVNRDPKGEFASKGTSHAAALSEHDATTNRIKEIKKREAETPRAKRIRPLDDDEVKALRDDVRAVMPGTSVKKAKTKSGTVSIYPPTTEPFNAEQHNAVRAVLRKHGVVGMVDGLHMTNTDTPASSIGNLVRDDDGPHPSFAEKAEEKPQEKPAAEPEPQAPEPKAEPTSETEPPPALADAKTPEDLAKRLWSTENKFPPTWHKEDWGGNRGQGKRHGKMVMGAMADPPRGVKSYIVLFGGLPDYEQHKEDLDTLLFAPEGQLAGTGYLKARSAGLEHEDAMHYAYGLVDAEGAKYLWEKWHPV